jgi:glycosyltransferase involved in cell wall biosynthesis
MNKVFLTIVIPTYNRGNKLNRLLNLLFEQISDGKLSDFVNVLVSDNNSTDNTRAICDKFLKNINFEYFFNSTNIGFDKNIIKSYQSVKSEYVWFFADDDIPKSNSVHTIYKTLKSSLPEILLYSFAQPQHSNIRFFDYPEKVYETKNIKESINLINKFPKISIYILKNDKRILEPRYYESFLGLGWMHIILSYNVLYFNKESKVSIISQILATCDEDFDKISWDPNIILNGYKIQSHKLIQDYFPELYSQKKRSSYLDSIQFCFAAKTGSLRVENIQEYDMLIRKIPFEFKHLIKNKKSLVQLLILKLKLIKIYQFLFTKNQ